jgi:multiple sugar transport system substrate-binding protein
MKLRLFTFVVVASLLLAACGGTKPAADNAPAEISMMMWGDPAELEVWNQIVTDFQQVKPNIKVKVEVSDWDSYWTKLKTLLSAGTPPDVFAIDAPLYLDYQSRGVLLNLQPYIDKNPDMLNGVYPQTLEAYKTPDGMFGLPRDFQTVVLFFNKDMFDAAGLAYPTADWTYEDLREAAKGLTKDTNSDGKTDQFGFYADLWDMELVWSEGIWAYGGDIINADRTRTLIGEPGTRSRQLFNDMMFEDKSWPIPTAGEYGGDPFPARRGCHDHHRSLGCARLCGVNFKWDVAPMPRPCRAGNQCQQCRLCSCKGFQESGCRL